ncbi:MAG TPA: hypothetical protein VFE62_09685 [Gemmataceae bacterium]|nr:hypothetical protein [Gemmataceae bacterium]
MTVECWYALIVFFVIGLIGKAISAMANTSAGQSATNAAARGFFSWLLSK